MPIQTVEDIEVFYDTAGAGVPVILIPGLGADHRTWGYFFRSLAGRFLAIRYNHRGMDKTTRGTKPINSHTLAGDLLGLMAALELESAHLVGASMGGPIAVIAATERPERVRTLTLAITTPRVDAAHRALFAQLRQVLVRDGMEAYARRAIPLCFSERFRRERPRDMEQIIKTFAGRKSSPQTILEQIDGCIPTDVEDRLGRITCPTLVLNAGLDALIQPSAALLAARIPNARSVVIEDSGHDIFVEQPERTTREIEHFLSLF